MFDLKMHWFGIVHGIFHSVAKSSQNVVKLKPIWLILILQLEVDFAIGRDITPDTINRVTEVLQDWYVLFLITIFN